MFLLSRSRPGRCTIGYNVIVATNVFSIVAPVTLLAAPAITSVCISALTILAAANYFPSQTVVASFLAAAQPVPIPKRPGVLFFASIIFGANGQKESWFQWTYSLVALYTFSKYMLVNDITLQT
jgi:hypothetical protein